MMCKKEPDDLPSIRPESGNLFCSESRTENSDWPFAEIVVA